MDNYQLISSFLSYFDLEWYTSAIKEIRQEANTNPQDWSRVVEIIQSRDLLPGQPLSLVSSKANQLLYENSDEESFFWLDLMIRNVERIDDQIEEY